MITRAGLALWSAAAVLTFAAHDADRASAASLPILLECPAARLSSLCEGTAQALRDLHGGTPVQIVSSKETGAEGEAAMRLGFVIERENRHVLAASLEWVTAWGQTGRGPLVELSVMDAEIDDRMLREFARHLVGQTNFPI